MAEGIEVPKVEVPILDQAASEIKERGSFQRELKDSELADIMRGVVGSLLTGQEKVKASVPTMDVRIGNQQGKIDGRVLVEKPVKAEIGINLVLGNDSVPGKLRLVSLDVQEKAGFATKMVLKAVNIKGKAEQVLRDPNQALMTAIDSQLKPKGVELTGIKLGFGQDALSVNLQGRPVAVGK
ncbi:MAG: hypothetical protein AAB639_01645 [Patescibacteria group bacterium]